MANGNPPRPDWPARAAFRIGDKVQKRSGGSWRGTIVGWYRTALTADGYAVESAYEPGSVQIYPATALEPWPQPEPSSMPLYLKCLTETAIRPTRASDGSAGLDLYADHSAILSPGERKKIQTGIAVAIAPGYVGMICPRSGMAYHDGVTVLNAPGIIDADYRGEIGVLLINHGDLVYEVVRGMRIAQLLVVPVGVPSLLEVDTLPETARGPAGFGSSGR